jgi:beta-glucanase (GH16 family)
MKKNIIFSVVLSLSALVTPAQLLLKVVNDSLVSYKYAGGDEFNSSQLNENDWTSGMGWTRVLMSQEVAFSPKRVKFSDGVLNLETDLEDSTYVLNPWEVDSNMIKKEKFVMTNSRFRTKYVSASIISKKKYHYGLYELRFKVEEGKGVWPAFWFFGGYKNEEIDAFELKCEHNNLIHVDTHCPYGCDQGYKNKIGLNSSWGGWMPVSGYMHDGFNTMALEWTPGEVYWYINGYPLAYFKGDFPNPMNLYINSNVAADGRAFKPGPDASTHWPNAFYVDYFRAWQPIGQSGPLVLKANRDLTMSSRFPQTKLKPVKKRGLMYWKSKLRPINGMALLNLNDAGKLTITISGELKEAGSAVELLTKRGKVSVSNTDEKTEIDLDNSEQQVELVIKQGKKEIRKYIQISR